MTNTYTDTHLDPYKAMDCPEALAYFWKAFVALTDEEQDTWIATFTPDVRFELGSLSLLADQLDTAKFVELMDEFNLPNDRLDAGLSKINDSLADTDFENAEYRNTYVPQYAEALSLLIVMAQIRGL